MCKLTRLIGRAPNYMQFLSPLNHYRAINTVYAQCSCGIQLICAESTAKKLVKSGEEITHDARLD